MVSNRYNSEAGVTLLEVLIGLTLFLVLTPIVSSLILNQLETANKQTQRKERIETIAQGNRIFTDYLPLAQVLIDTRDNSLEWAVQGPQGPRYYHLWVDSSDCTARVAYLNSLSTSQRIEEDQTCNQHVYYRYREPAINLIPNSNFNEDWLDGYDWNGNCPINALDSDPCFENEWNDKLVSGNLGQPGRIDYKEWVDKNKNGTQQATEIEDFNGDSLYDRNEWNDNDDGLFAPTEWTDLNNNGRVDAGEWTDANNNYRIDDEKDDFKEPPGWRRNVYGSQIDEFDLNPVQLPNIGGEGNSVLTVSQPAYSPPRNTYTWVESPVYPAAPGDVFLIGGLMRDLNPSLASTSTEGNPTNGWPRIEWYWVRKDKDNAQSLIVRGDQSLRLIQERSGSVIKEPDSTSLDTLGWRSSVTQQAPQGVVGIVLRLSPALLSRNDGAVYDRMLLQRVPAGRKIESSSDLYFDREVSPTSSVYKNSAGEFTPNFLGESDWLDDPNVSANQRISIFGLGANIITTPRCPPDPNCPPELWNPAVTYEKGETVGLKKIKGDGRIAPTSQWYVALNPTTGSQPPSSSWRRDESVRLLFTSRPKLSCTSSGCTEPGDFFVYKNSESEVVNLTSNRRSQTRFIEMNVKITEAPGGKSEKFLVPLQRGGLDGTLLPGGYIAP
jgi:type II secretory pathway pseudopilin PulG